MALFGAVSQKDYIEAVNTLQKSDDKVKQLSKKVDSLKRQLEEARNASLDNDRTIQVYRDAEHKLRAELEAAVTDSRRLQKADGLWEWLLDQLTELEQSDEVVLDAEAHARETVLAKLRESVTERMAAKLIAEQEVRIRAQFGPDKIEEIKQALRQQFELDGTFDEVARRVQSEVEMSILENLKTEAAKTEETRLAEAEMRQQTIRRVQAMQSTLTACADAVEKHRKALIAGWEVEALQLAIEDAKKTAEAEKDAFVTKFRHDYPKSEAGKKRLAAAKEEGAKDGKALTIEELVAAAKSESFAAAVKARVDAATTRFEESELFTRHLAAFQREGVDMTAIPKGANVTVTLGVMGTGTANRWSQWSGKTDKKNVPQLDESRRLVLSSLGDGKFIVKLDTLSDDPNRRQDAIVPGSVIELGRVMRPEGKPVMEQRLIEGASLVYIDKTSWESYVPAGGLVANMAIDGTQARTDFFQTMQVDGTVVPNPDFGRDYSVIEEAPQEAKLVKDSKAA